MDVKNKVLWARVVQLALVEHGLDQIQPNQQAIVANSTPVVITCFHIIANMTNPGIVSPPSFGQMAHIGNVLGGLKESYPDIVDTVEMLVPGYRYISRIPRVCFDGYTFTFPDGFADDMCEIEQFIVNKIREIHFLPRQENKDV